MFNSKLILFQINNDKKWNETKMKEKRQCAGLEEILPSDKFSATNSLL